MASSLFAALDKDGDGKVSASDLRGGCTAAAALLLSEEEAAAIVAASDTDGDGLLDRDEFLRLAEVVAGEDDNSCLREAFRMYAAEDGGEELRRITPASLRRMLGRLGSPLLDVDECRAMICRFDLDGDGVLSFDEFRIMMHARWPHVIRPWLPHYM